MTDQPDWITKVNKAACFARHHVLEQLRKVVLEKQEWQEKYLKEEYGKGWTVMVRCPIGSGYEICQDIINAINEIEEMDDKAAGITLPVIFLDECKIHPTNRGSYLRAAFEDQLIDYFHSQPGADEFAKALREALNKEEKT